MPVCPKCGQYYVREPCPTCGYTQNQEKEHTPEPTFAKLEKSAQEIPAVSSPIVSESPQPTSEKTVVHDEKPVQTIEKKPIDTGIDPLEVENRKLRTELEIAKRELQGYQEKVKEAITKIDRILRDLSS